MLRDFISLLYPQICAGCSGALLKNEEQLCTTCRLKMPKTNYHLEKINPVFKLFAGKINLSAATALYHFTKGGIVQNAMHELKYNANQLVGEQLGRMMGNILKEVQLFSDCDAIVPVPLHPKKQKIRGYNQSDAIGRGMAAEMNIEMDETILQRNVFSATQTRKSRFERWENVDSIFIVPKPEMIEGKKVLLIDDVVTTGATLESCAQVLLNVQGVQVCIATAACA